MANIIEKTYNFSSQPAARSTTSRIIIHHTAGPDTPAEEIHTAHLANKWAGIGYHFVIRKDGSIERGRPEDTIGSHAEGANSNSIGISLCGNFENEEPAEAQINSLRSLVNDLCKKYNLTANSQTVIGHRDVNSTACPGANLYNKLDTIRLAEKMEVEPGKLVTGMYGPYAAQAVKTSSGKKVPASILIAMALQYGGNDCAKIQGWNPFKMKFVSSISSGPETSDGLCTFDSLSDAFSKLITYIKNTNQMASGMSKLHENLNDMTADEKKQFVQDVIPPYVEINSVSGGPSEIQGLIDKHNLYEWDTDEAAKKEPDQTLVSQMSAYQTNKNGLNGGGSRDSVGLGIDRQMVGKDTVKLTKLPKGKTNPCEPIYPDLITVGDSVPKWVLDMTEVKVNAEVAASGVDAAQGAYSPQKKKVTIEKITEFDNGYAQFKDSCFKTWLKRNNLLEKYDTRTVKDMEECQKAYEEAAAKDKDGKQFYNGIYYGGDGVIKNKLEKFEEKSQEVDKLKNEIKEK